MEGAPKRELTRIEYGSAKPVAAGLDAARGSKIGVMFDPPQRVARVEAPAETRGVAAMATIAPGFGWRLNPGYGRATTVR
jgi:hypothetical protein